MKIKRPLAAAACAIAAVSFILACFFPQLIMPQFSRLYAENLTDGDELIVSGRVYKIQEKTYSMYIYLKNSRAGISEDSLTRAGEVLLVVSKDDYEQLDLKIGNRIFARCSFLEFNNARNNGNYDEENYYKSLGIFLKAGSSSVQVTSGFVNIPFHLMFLFKNRIISSIDEIIPDENSAVKGIFIAVLTGDRTYLTEGTKDLYSENGIAHILAVSGLHISIIGMGLFSALKKILGPYKSALTSSLVMLMYCIMCGLGVSALRACIMFIVHMAAVYTGKTYDLISALSLAAIIILLSNPFYILNSAFQLSFTAIISVGVANKNLAEFLNLKRKISKSLLSSACISVISLPLIANSYFTIPLYAVLLNLIVIPLMSVVLLSGLFGGMGAMLSAFLGRFFIGIGFYTVNFINACCYIASLLWMSCVVCGYVKTVRFILFYLAVCVFLVIIRKTNLADREKSAAGKENKGKLKKLKRNFIVFAMLICLVVLVFTGKKENGLKIIMFDVDQGECILIITPENLVIMIDGGSTTEDELWQYRLESALEYENISKIDYSIITHPDTDHISGIIDLLNDKTTPVYIENLLIPYVQGSENYTQLVSAAQQNAVNVINIYAGMSIETETVSLSFLHPESGSVYEDSNDYSAVISLSYGSFSALFTGDISQEVELSLIEEGSLLDSYDVLKVAHHGSKYSSCEEFLSRVSPATAIISAGIGNSYGHPADETISRLEDAGADIYITAELGEIIINADENGDYEIWTKF